MLGIPEECVQGQRLFALLHRDDLLELSELFDRSDGDASGFNHESRWRAANGLFRHIRWHWSPGTGETFHGVGHDVSDLHKELAILRGVVDAAPNALLVAGSEGKITLANRSCEQLFGYRRGELLGQQIEVLVPESLRRRHIEQRQSFAAGQARRPMGAGRDLFGRHRDGRMIPLEIGLNAVAIGGERRVIASMVDISNRAAVVADLTKETVELQLQVDEISLVAMTDELTGAGNRRQFYQQLIEMLEQAYETDKPLSLILLDVDNFKQFNDTNGHVAGDEALRHVAEVLRQAARQRDIVARYGGEEFAVLLPETDEAGAMAFSERCRHLIATTSENGLIAPLTASFGVATLVPSIEAGGASKEVVVQLIDRADRALYRSKAHGKNRTTHAGDLS